MLSDILLDSFVPKSPRANGELGPVATASFVAVSDLFGSLDNHIAALMSAPSNNQTGPDRSPIAAFVLGSDAALTVDWNSVRPSHIQTLISSIERLGDRATEGPVKGVQIDPACGLTFWTRTKAGQVPEIAELWRTINAVGRLDEVTWHTTPRLYGNKLRLTGFVTPIVATHLTRGAPILDLMAGTGVMSRALAERHPVSNNDANPYAALLSRSQGLDGRSLDVQAILARLEAPYAENHSRLSVIVHGALAREGEFLHGEIQQADIKAYADFAEEGPLQPSDGEGPGPARLVTERYANVYFGVLQSVEIDSLRAAIEACYPQQGPERDLCLSALLLACTTCSSGAHFAQPQRLKPELDKARRQMRNLIERRAKSVAWEFDLAVGRLATREPLAYPISRSTRMDWREALHEFAGTLGGQEGGVYADPPYSKLQYSRYYHVLNVILDYGYPTVAGSGRYPPRADRFSSRFEYQPGGARRELSALLQSCSERGLTTFLSYSDGGFVPIEFLVEEVGRHFPTVKLFTEEVRHHAQGRALKSSRALVREHVLVGSHRSL